MTIVTMMERKECVEIDPAQFFQQFNLQAGRDMHDLIFDVDENDLVAVFSTFQQLLGLGEQSLFAIWDMPIHS